jgi:hypothetical protein
METKFQEKWYQLCRVHPTFLFNNMKQSLQKTNMKIRQIKRILRKYDTSTSADEMYSRIMYQSCAFVSISWLHIGGNKNQARNKRNLSGIRINKELDTHEKLEAILS